MIAQVNGQAVTFQASITIVDLIEQLGYADQRIAVEINEDIIPKSRHAEHQLQDGDKIEIIKAVGGG